MHPKQFESMFFFSNVTHHVFLKRPPQYYAHLMPTETSPVPKNMEPLISLGKKITVAQLESKKREQADELKLLENPAEEIDDRNPVELKDIAMPSRSAGKKIPLGFL
jgi:hypothetical protein